MDDILFKRYRNLVLIIVTVIYLSISRILYIVSYMGTYTFLHDPITPQFLLALWSRLTPGILH